ncbi:hypothetical protein BLNAU_8248 [Blattamonas nauphoetae]|uniref:Transmembrane protein n=1 Tax=Blattamonas nauphoetae TaxID=2049346 RepID=A0ABQ9XZ77_9EUKA|nr:hypothetical protein BLNAU_8248 [Blattamonas nauphoetae]
MKEVKNGIPPSSPFPWFLPDCLMSVLILILVWRFWVPPRSETYKHFKVGIITVTFSVLLFFLFELFANHRLTNQLSLAQNTPIPPRARIPLKTLLAAQGVVLAFILPELFSSQPDAPVQSHSNHNKKERSSEIAIHPYSLDFHSSSTFSHPNSSH